MSGVGWSAQTSEVATGTALKTIIQVIAAANHALLVHEWSVSFKGVSTTGTPILVEVLRQTTGGTMSSLTPVKDPNDDSDETLQVTAQHTATAEPTAGDVLKKELVHPQTGYTWQAPFGKPIKVGGGDRLGIRVTSAADVNCVARFSGEE
jgi:hypothetical protein